MSVHCQADDERFSFEAFTRHPFFTEVNRWIVERVIGPGRRKIVDLGCGPGAVTKLILERLGGDARNVEVIGIDPSPSALSKARAAIHSQVVKFIEGSAEWVSRIVSSVDARSEEHTSEPQSQSNLVCRLLLEKKKKPT